MIQTAAPARTLKPPLKWAGGKRWLARHLQPVWEAYRHRRYVEPFCGGLALPLAFTPERALLNDTNPHLIGFYKRLQDGLTINIETRNDKALYYHHRETFNRLVRDGQGESEHAASIFYYLNRTCYNGLCRFNRKGEFNVPFGSYSNPHYARDFYEYQETLGAWDFTAGDFQDIDLERDDFVYADPPYDVEFVSYSKQGFDWNDQVRLAEWLARHRGPVVLSNQATDRVVELYKALGFKLEYLDAPRRISCNGDRTPAKEVLALKGF